MSARVVVRMVRARLALATAVFVATVLVALAVAAFVPATYSSTFTLYVSAQQDARDSTAAYEGTLLSQQRVKSYTELVTSTRVTSQVIRDLQLQETPDQLSRKISASSSTDSVLVNVAVLDSSPLRAKKISDAVAGTFVGVVNELERPSNPRASPTVLVRIVEPASTPVDPVSLGFGALAILGAAAGIALGVGAALIRDSMDDSVKTSDQLAMVSGFASLGHLSNSDQLTKDPLLFAKDSQSLWAEEVRRVRTNISLTRVDNPVVSLLCTSSVPGEGKTTTALSLAMASVAAGDRTVIIEADLRRPQVSQLLGMERSVGLTTILAGKISVHECIQSTGQGLDVISSGLLPPNPAEILSSVAMATLLNQLRQDYRYIIIDSAPVLPVADSLALAAAVDGVLLVSAYKTTSIRTVERSAEALRRVSANAVGSLLTKAPGSRTESMYSSYYSAQNETEAVETRHRVDSPRHRTNWDSTVTRPSPRSR